MNFLLISNKFKKSKQGRGYTAPFFDSTTKGSAVSGNFRACPHPHTFRKSGAGFTIMEILVATTLFAFSSVALTSLFNYTLRINRKAEVLRQATQGMRDFMELMVKQVRNGQIDYGVINGQTITSAVGPCPTPPSADFPNGSGGFITRAPVGNESLSGAKNLESSYNHNLPENRLGIVDQNGNRYCFFLGDASGNYVGGSQNSGATLVVQKQGGSPQIVNPPNYTINYLEFLIRPSCDPYVTICKRYGNATPKIQPFVTMLIQFTTQLPTGEQQTINYQTTVSTDKYDVPSSP